MPTFGSLFAGIGAEMLGLERAAWECKWAVEIDPFCQRVLKARFPEASLMHNVTWQWPLQQVDLIAGGFPCQDISNAHTNGTREALSGNRSGLWKEFHRIIKTVRPRFAIIENVAAWQRWVPDVRTALGRIGYASVPVQLSAGSFGAPHKRPRVFVVADSDSHSQSLRTLHEKVARLRPVPRAGRDWRAPPPGGLRVDDGSANGMDRCRALGNSVSPCCLEYIGRHLMEEL